MAISPQITSLAIVLVMMQVSKLIPFEDPRVLLGVRVAYVISNLIVAGIYFRVRSIINQKKDLKTIKYVEPAPMGSGEEPKPVTTTVHAYDLQQLNGLFKGQLMGIAMMAFMHGYLKFTNPLVLQSILPLKGVFEGNLVKIHLLGKEATGDLKRPFKAGGGLMSLLTGGSSEIASDKKSVEAAEKAGRGGAKEE